VSPSDHSPSTIIDRSQPQDYSPSFTITIIVRRPVSVVHRRHAVDPAEVALWEGVTGFCVVVWWCDRTNVTILSLGREDFIEMFGNLEEFIQAKDVRATGSMFIAQLCPLLPLH
jgi:hypothetical protein